MTRTARSSSFPSRISPLGFCLRGASLHGLVGASFGISIWVMIRSMKGRRLRDSVVEREVHSMTSVVIAQQVLDESEREAWAAYLNSCRTGSPASYEDREGPAWALLQAHLRRLKRERERLTA